MGLEIRNDSEAYFWVILWLLANKLSILLHSVASIYYKKGVNLGLTDRQSTIGLCKPLYLHSVMSQLIRYWPVIGCISLRLISGCIHCYIRSKRVNECCTVYQAELIAGIHTARVLLKYLSKRIQLFADYRSVLKVLP